MDERDRAQLEALADVAALFKRERLDSWLFGGWAVDFYAGAVTRPHFDVDFMVWLADMPRIAELLLASDWRHAPEEDEDGGTGYERGGVRLELTFLERGEDGRPCIPLRSGPWPLADGTLGEDVGELGGVRARVIAFEALRSGKARAREDEEDAVKDRADSQVLDRIAGDGVSG